MEYKAEKAKNGDLTCKIDSFFLHSAYNPQREGEKFTETVQSPFEPEIIFIAEPALSYCAKPLKNKFPKSKIIAVRFCDFFKEYDSLFDEAIYYSPLDENFENFMFSKFGEEKISYSSVIVWESASKVFQTETMGFLSSCKNLINKSHAVLRTRSFFEKRWIKNSVNFASRVDTCVEFTKKGTCPVLICASGPSLENAIPAIKKYAKKSFVIALSSAIRPLLKNGITPDLCLSTDGGFWAKKHLNILERIKTETIFALACEGIAGKRLLESSKIFPLKYTDGIESQIAQASGLNFFTAQRCGTVSGTALYLAEKLSAGEIYFFGLDLSLQKGFQHTQPNELEDMAATSDNRIFSKETRSVKSEFSNQGESLKIYADWFTGTKTLQKTFRVIENPQNKLGKIEDIKISEFEKKSAKFTGEKPVFIDSKIAEKTERRKKIENFIKTNCAGEDWLKNCFPVEYLKYTHSISESEKNILHKELQKKNGELLKKL